jgi:hypothetical protein
MVRSADSFRRARSMPPWTMPKRDCVESAVSSVRFPVSSVLGAAGSINWKPELETGNFLPRHFVLVLLEIFLAAFCPAQGQFHRSLGAGAVGGIFRALIERHDDVGAQADLSGHGTLRTEEVRGAIEVRTKRHALVGNLAQVVQAENLEAAGIGEDGSRPRHEAVQAAELADGFDSRTQIEVIGVAQKNLHAEFFENILRDRFHGPDRAHGHEHRSLDLAMRREQASGPGPACAGIDMEFNGHSCDCSNGTVVRG